MGCHHRCRHSRDGIMETNRKKMTRGADISFQEKERESARLRRIGRGRKHGFVLSPYLEGYTRIFGETDIFKNLKAA